MAEGLTNINIETKTLGREDLTSTGLDTKEVTAGDLDTLRKEMELLAKDGRSTKTSMVRIENITYLGFIIIILMVAALVFAYLEFVYSGSKNDDYKYMLFEKVTTSENNLKILKNCLNLSRWLDPNCFNE